MFKIISLLALFSACSTFATGKTDTYLEGKTYCRTVKTDGTFGQPKGTRQHCVSFNDGLMRNNANTFFGNPPSRSPYSIVKGTKVYVVQKNGEKQLEFIILKESDQLGAVSEDSDDYSYILDLQ